MLDSLICDTGLIQTVNDTLNNLSAVDSSMFDQIPSMKEILYDSIASLKTNDFFQGGLILGMLAWIGMQLKSVPLYLWSRIKRAVKFSVYFDDTENLYPVFSKWFEEKYPKKFKNIKADITTNKNDDYLIDIEQRDDWNWFFYKGNFIFVDKARTTLEHAMNKRDRYLDSYEMYSFFSRKQVMALIEELRSIKERGSVAKSGFNIKFNDAGGYWENMKSRNYKKFDSLFMEYKEELLEDLDKYLESSELYKRIGINCKRGYLFYGPPGTGKSSIAFAMADKLDYDLYILNLNSVQSDDTLIELISAVDKNSIILLEDIDTFIKPRFGKSQKNRVGFSTLLNVLSGAYEPNNCIFVMTTNDIDVLDPALIRSGRIDKVQKIDHPRYYDIAGFMALYYKKDVELINKYITEKYKVEDLNVKTELSMSTVQDLCLRSNTFEESLKKLFSKT